VKAINVIIALSLQKSN